MKILKMTFFPLLFLFCILAVSGCRYAENPGSGIVNGTADLRDGNINSSILELNGLWEFYPGRLIAPADFSKGIAEKPQYIKVPGDWRSVQNAKGFGTYRLKIFLPENYCHYSLKLLWVKSVSALWIDDTLLIRQGEIKDPPVQSVPGDYIIIEEFKPAVSEFYITIHVVNYHDRRGGLCFPVLIAPPPQMYKNEMKLTFMNSLVIGALAIVILFHFALHYYFRRLSLNLYISLVCCMVLMRLFILTDSSYIYSLVKWIGYTHLVKIEFAGLILIFVFLLQFFTKLYLGDSRINIKRGLFWTGMASLCYVAAMPVYYCKAALPFFQFYLLAVTLFILLSPIRAGIKQGERGARIYCTIIVIAMISFINDIIYFLTSRGFPNITGYMFFLFLLGHFLILSMHFSEVFNKNISLIEEISIKKSIMKRLSYLSSTDSLTELYNRRFFDNYLIGKIKDHKKSENLWIVIFDIDFFKKVNDDFGHSAGDTVLKEMSRLVRGLIRSDDLLCRWGGEEFVIVISGMDEAGISHFTERMRESIEEYSFSVERTITASFGVARFKHGESASNFIHRADTALYDAKSSGRNRVVFAERTEI